MQNVPVLIKFIIDRRFLNKFFLILIVKETFSTIPNIQSEDLSPVTDAIGHALFSVMPRSVYRCNCHFLYGLSLLPEWLNDWYFAMPPPAGVTQS